MSCGQFAHKKALDLGFRSFIFGNILEVSEVMEMFSIWGALAIYSILQDTFRQKSLQESLMGIEQCTGL